MRILQLYRGVHHSIFRHPLVGIAIPGLDHPYLMIGKGHILVRQFHFRHVAACAIRLGDRTKLRRTRNHGCTWLRRSRMASQTFRVVVSLVPNHILVRIVAGQAANARIGSVITSAVRQPVRLEADIHRASPVISHHRFPRTMALTAKSAPAIPIL